MTPKQPYQITLLLAGLFLSLQFSPHSVHSQPPPGITENDSGAERLRVIWSKKGTGQQGTRVGISAAGLGDVNDDGFDDFTVRVSNQYWVFLGGSPPSDIPVQILDSTGGSGTDDPVVGDFLGTGENLYGYIQPLLDESVQINFLRMPLFRYDLDSHMVRTEHELNLRIQIPGTMYHAADLDDDGDDELIFIDPEKNGDAVVRIYEGGPSFSLEEPTTMFRFVDTGSTSGTLSFYSAIADFDGDTFLDLTIGRLNAATFDAVVTFWWGSEQGYDGWTDSPGREIFVPVKTPGPDPIYAEIVEDFDGDQIPEIVRRIRFGDSLGTYVWLSRGNESARTREFTAETADRFYPGAVRNRGFGFVADSLQRYEMMGLHANGRDIYGLGGGYYGPNDTYDVVFGGSDGPAFGGVDAGDINGDGWRDRLIASETYGGPNVGIAVIVAGGPYIPSDDATVSVHPSPVAGEPAAYHLWPNPVVDQLHLVWRGDLPQMPSRMVMHDAGGRLLLDRGLPTWEGTVTLSMGEHPSGSYLITLFDANDMRIGSFPFLIVR